MATTLQPLADPLGPGGTELVATTEKAGEELKAVQSVRDKAAKARARAQHAPEEAEDLEEEAEGIMVQARNTFAKALALNPEALRSMADSMRTLEEAIRTERQLRQQTRADAEEEADSAKQKATDALLSALSSVRKASNYISRELEEANRIASTAESLKESSLGDLERAEAMRSEAESHMRQEARKLLDQPPGSHTTLLQETAARSRATDSSPEVQHAPPSISGSYRAPEAPPAEAPPAEPQLEAPLEVVWEMPAREVDKGERQAVSDEAAADRPTSQEERDTAAPQGQAEAGHMGRAFGSIDDLEASLNEFLESSDQTEEVHPGDGIPAPAQILSDGLFLDNLDFSRGDAVRHEPEQPLYYEDVKDVEHEESTPDPSRSPQPPPAEADSEFSDDFLTHLREALGTTRSAEEIVDTSLLEELPVPSPSARSRTTPGQSVQLSAADSAPAPERVRSIPEAGEPAHMA